MNVLMINNEFPPLGGGTATVNANLLRAFADDDSLSIELITSSGGASKCTLTPNRNTRIHRVKVKTQNSPHHATILDLVSFIISALPYSLKLHRKQDFDLIFAWATLPAGMLAWILKKVNGTPYIVRVSGPDIPGWEKRYSILTKILSPIIKMIWRDAAITTAKSEEERAAVLRCCAGLKVSLLPTAVPSNGNTPLRRVNRPIKFLYVARLIARKRHELLLRTLALLPPEIEWSISFVGMGDEERKLRSIAKELALENSVKFYGYVAREQISGIYNEHDVFISLSENESMSVAALEALASGMQCIMSRSAACGLTERPGITLLEKSNAEELGKELLNALRAIESSPIVPAFPEFLTNDMANVYKQAFVSALKVTS